MDPSSKRQARDDNLTALSQARESAHSGEPSSSTQPCSQNSIRFADPRERAQKVFELYLRKNVPRSLRKCQRRCGKRIAAEDPPMIIRSIGENWWTNKTTGKEMSRVGPMYVHFNQNRLELFDTESFYGLTKRFDFSRIAINEGNHKELNEKERKELRDLGIKFL